MTSKSHPLLPFALFVFISQAWADHPPRPRPGSIEDQPPLEDKSGYNFFNPVPVESMREMTTDSAAATQSPYTVDAGHFQIEMTLAGYSSYSQSFEGVKYRFDWWSVGPINLKVGLFDQMDMELILEPYDHAYEREDNYLRSSRHGIGDTTLRFKFNCWGNDDGKTALALMPFFIFPTGREGLGNTNQEAGFIVPFSATLPWDMSLGLSGSAAWMGGDSGSRQHLEYTASAALFRKLFGKLEGYVECFNAISTESGVGRVTTFNTGLFYWLTEDLQLNAGVDLGLTKEADDWYAFIGTSWRY